MTGDPIKITNKIKPWKSMRTLEEDPNPDISGLNALERSQPCGGSGSSVSKPMDRRTGQSSITAAKLESGTAQT
ncbi:hypothetical protein ISF_02201 [Cordyceps fumosorosea ARSEF 2679]|uniref:Uncharacterized protein n=1 Tax=Cordyceps fumosorosea (strain ARSEF 2679) TaxID=1081104 RepID=A0A168BKG5_CORFA|nr:hypothetical protein ISF_02201 [Cordyceps fumosorosea ARSEF 2679]OAA70227.1 hypothetical protein ISF_02201 [Cordyceps fumosorosea ARSEF 2679]